MRVTYVFLVLATIVAGCLADCRPGLHGLSNWYRCDGITDLSQLPQDAVGLDIRDSNLTRISNNAFQAQANTLMELNITSSNVETIDPDAFKGLNKLEVLGLVNNKLQKLDASWIKNVPNLKALLVWRNQISVIDPEIYDLLPNLEKLDVAYNDLHDCLMPQDLAKLTKLNTILLSGNQWSYRCRRSMTWYIGVNHIRGIRNWGTSDLLIDECLAHEAGADVDDKILQDCVDRQTGSSNILQKHVAELNEKVRELTDRVMQLESRIVAKQN